MKNRKWSIKAYTERPITEEYLLLEKGEMGPEWAQR